MSNEEHKKARPLILEIEDAKNELLCVINRAIGERRIPCYMLRMILSGIYDEVAAKARAEIEYLRTEETNADNKADKT